MDRSKTEVEVCMCDDSGEDKMGMSGSKCEMNRIMKSRRNRGRVNGGKVTERACGRGTRKVGLWGGEWES